jgi:hypothetical protein
MYPSLSSLGSDQASTSSVIAGLDELSHRLRGLSGISADGADVHDGIPTPERSQAAALYAIDMAKREMLDALPTPGAASRAIWGVSASGVPSGGASPYARRSSLESSVAISRIMARPSDLSAAVRRLVAKQEAFFAEQRDDAARVAQTIVASRNEPPVHDSRSSSGGRRYSPVRGGGVDGGGGEESSAGGPAPPAASGLAPDEMLAWVRLAAVSGVDDAAPPAARRARAEWALQELLAQHRAALLGESEGVGAAPGAWLSTATSTSPPRVRGGATPTPFVARAVRAPHQVDIGGVERRFDHAALEVQAASAAVAAARPLPLSATSTSAVVRSARATLEAALEPLPWEYAA